MAKELDPVLDQKMKIKLGHLVKLHSELNYIVN